MRRLLVLLLGLAVVAGGLTPAAVATSRARLSVTPSIAIAAETVVLQGLLPTSPHRRVAVQRLDGRTWRAVSTVRTDKRGAFSVRASAGRAAGTLRFRVVHAGASKPLLTARLRVVAQSIALRVPGQLAPLATGQAVVTATPARRGRIVQLETQQASRWVAMGSARQDASGRATLTFAAPATGGPFQYRVRVLPAGGAAAAYSNIARVFLVSAPIAPPISPAPVEPVAVPPAPAPVPAPTSAPPGETPPPPPGAPPPNDPGTPPTPDPTPTPAELGNGQTTTLAGSTAFLYTGANPVQKGVSPGTIQPARAAVVRGRVLDGGGAPLAGVRVDILGRAELGWTLSQADGGFDLAVNGGGALTVTFSLAGYLAAQRQVDVSWRDFSLVEDVRLLQVDAQVTRVVPGSPVVQTARSSTVTDADGQRQVTMVFDPGTAATMRLPDGSQQSLPSLGVRATEFTVGPAGPDAMPGTLPAASAYTYAAELSVDEALAAGATRVDFSKPVAVYVDNFLKMPVGINVPTGYYDRGLGKWVASQDGRVIKLLTSGLAPTVDADGNGVADTSAQLNALGLDPAELARIGSLFATGATFWRVQVEHFTPYDCNWPYVPPPDATPPGLDPDEETPEEPEEPCERAGCIITPEEQGLGERIDVAGTPFTLNYRSSRAPSGPHDLAIPLSGPTVPASLLRIELEVEVAGRTFVSSYPAGPNLWTTFVWDGKDAYGQAISGARPATVTVGYVYQAVYATGSQFIQSFGAFAGTPLSANRTRLEITLSQTWTRTVGSLLAASQSGLGGWTLSEHHSYDAARRTLYAGDGTRRESGGTGRGLKISTYAAHSLRVGDVAVDAQGTVYFSEHQESRVFKVEPNGAVTVVAGTGVRGFSGDGGPATSAKLNAPDKLAIGPDNTLYIADYYNGRVRRVDDNGIIRTVAGTGVGNGPAGDGGPAVNASLWGPYALAFSGDGSLYISELVTARVRRVSPNGTISTVAGGNGEGYSGDGGPARSARLHNPQGIAIGPDGTLYIADGYNQRVRRVGLDGRIVTIAGTGIQGHTGDGGPATSAGLSWPEDLAVSPEGVLFIAEYQGGGLRRVNLDGIIEWVAGSPRGNNIPGVDIGDGGPAAGAAWFWASGVALGPDGTIYVGDAYNNRVRQIEPALPGFDLTDQLVPSDDGSEVYQFTGTGRHLRTVDALTGAVIRRFGYDAAGRLATITDADGNVTSIVRDAQGTAERILAPGGQTTALGLSPDGDLAWVENPAQERTSMAYAAGGLLTQFTDPAGGVDRFEYDGRGRLVRNVAQDGTATSYTRAVSANAVTVTETSAEGRRTAYRTERTAVGGARRTVTDPRGATTVVESAADGTQTMTAADGTRTVTQYAPDPRWGMLAPIPRTMTVRLPSGLTSSTTRARTATLNDPSDPLSLARQTDTVVNNGRTSTIVFDAATRTTTQTSAEGRVTSSVVDAKGQLTKVEPGSGLAPVTFAYDSRGRLISAVQGTMSMSYTYDARNRMVASRDASGAETAYGYDTADRVISLRQPGGGVLRYGYDALGRVTSVQLPGGGEHRLAYSPVGTMSAFSPAGSPAGLTRRYDRDRAVKSMGLPSGATLDYGQDSFGRPTGQTFAGADVGLAYSDLTTRITSMTRTPSAGGSAESISRASDGGLETRRTISGSSNGVFQYTYANDLLPNAIRLTSGATTLDIPLGRDRDGLVTRTGPFTIARSGPAGAVSSIGDGTLALAYDYDTLGRGTARTSDVAGRQAYKVVSTYDARGRIVRSAENGPGGAATMSYGYDADGRLIRVDRDGSVVERYTYDSDGNRTTRQLGSGPVQTLSYDAQQRLAAGPGGTYQFDADGFLARRGSDRFTYSAKGELLEATVGGQSVSYSYDGLGRRVARTDAAGTTSYLYGELDDPFRVTAARDAGGALTTYSYDRQGLLIAMQRGGSRYYIATDQVGTPRVVTDATGTPVKALSYDTFGSLVSDSAPGFALPFGFAGGLSDPVTSLVRFGYRDYEPATGRWTARDPALLAGGSANLYAYVGNDPVGARDPRGTAALLLGAPLMLLPVLGQALLIAAAVIAAAALLAQAISAMQNAADPPSGDSSPGDSTSGEPAAAPTSGGGGGASGTGSGEGYCPIPLPDNPADSPGEGWEWRGKPPVGGDKGAWHNPESGESLHPDLNHGPPIGPHWDWTDSGGKGWRVYPGGRAVPK